MLKITFNLIKHIERKSIHKKTPEKRKTVIVRLHPAVLCGRGGAVAVPARCTPPPLTAPCWLRGINHGGGAARAATARRGGRVTAAFSGVRHRRPSQSRRRPPLWPAAALQRSRSRPIGADDRMTPRLTEATRVQRGRAIMEPSGSRGRAPVMSGTVRWHAEWHICSYIAAWLM